MARQQTIVWLLFVDFSLLLLLLRKAARPARFRLVTSSQLDHLNRSRVYSAHFENCPPDKVVSIRVVSNMGVFMIYCRPSGLKSISVVDTLREFCFLFYLCCIPSLKWIVECGKMVWFTADLNFYFIFYHTDNLKQQCFCTNFYK